MTYYLVMNGAGRRPHVEEVETAEDVRSRLEAEQDPNDIVVIHGEVVNHQREEYLFLEDQTIPLDPSRDGRLETPGGLPEWVKQAQQQEEAEDDQSEEASTATWEAEHPGDVEGHPGGETDDAPGEEPGEGSESGGDGEDRGSGAEGEGRRK